MPLIFVACRKFDSSCGDAWLRYIDWSGFDHIQEVVSTDIMLCPSLIDTLIDEDWNFNIREHYYTHCFRDYQYLKRRIRYDASRHNILALTKRPTQAPAAIEDFTFCGYDILDCDESISVLLNCGSFPAIYTAADLNPLGLVDDLDRAVEIAQAIRESYPDDYHCCDCRVVGIARYSIA